MEDRDLIKKFAMSINRGEALDLGAGNGEKSEILKELGFKVTSLEYKEDSAEKIKNKNIEVVCQDMRKFNFPKDRYVFVLASASLDFLDKKEKETLLEKTYDSLKNHGWIFLFVFSKKDPLHEVASQKWEKIEKGTYFFPEKMRLHSDYINYLSKNEWTKLLKVCGFKNIMVEEIKINDAHPTPHEHSVLKITAKK